MKKNSNHFLTLLVVSLLTLYHVINLAKRHQYRFSYHMGVSELALVRAKDEKRLAALKIPEPVLESDPNRMDFAMQSVSGLGYVIRYLAHQLPEFIIRGSNAPNEYFNRAETKLMTPSAASEMLTHLGTAAYRFVMEMRTQGIIPVILPVPAKVAIEADRYGKTEHPSELWEGSPPIDNQSASSAYHKFVAKIPAEAIDLSDIFESTYSKHPTDDLYIPIDNHWTSYGIAISAKAIIDSLQKRGECACTGQIIANRFATLEPRYRFNLSLALLLPEWFWNQELGGGFSEPVYKLNANCHLKSAGRLVLAGTSFSERFKNTSYGLGHLLEASLHTSLIDLSKGAEGPLHWVEKLHRRGIHLRQHDVIVWEFPIDAAIGYNDVSIPFVN